MYNPILDEPLRRQRFILAHGLRPTVKNRLIAKGWRFILEVAVPKALELSEATECPMSKIDRALAEREERKIPLARNCFYVKHFQRATTFWPHCQKCGNEEIAHALFMFAAWLRCKELGVYFLGDHPHIAQHGRDTCHVAARAFDEKSGAVGNSMRRWELVDLISYYRSGYATSTLIKKAAKDSAAGRVLEFVMDGKLENRSFDDKQLLITKLQSLPIELSQLSDDEKIRQLRQSGLMDWPKASILTAAEKRKGKKLSARSKSSAYKSVIKSRLVAGLTQLDAPKIGVEAAPKVDLGASLQGPHTRPRKLGNKAAYDAFKKALREANEQT